jgi:hypothetical protein
MTDHITQRGVPSVVSMLDYSLKTESGFLNESCQVYSSSIQFRTTELNKCLPFYP